MIEGELGEPIDPVIGVQVLEVVEQLVMVGRKHPWWGKTEIELSGLKGQTFIMRQRSSQTRIWLDDILQVAEVRPKIGAEFDNVESIKRAVMNSTNIAILPAYTLQSEHAQAEFWTIPVGAEPLQRTLKLIWNRETLFSPVVRAFLIYLQRSFPAIDIAKICNH